MAADWSRPLFGLNVLDISDGVAAGFTARLFAQLGATVRRVRHGPQSDDIAREVTLAPTDLQRRVRDYLHGGKSIVDIGTDSWSVPGIAPLLGETDLIVQDRGEDVASQLLELPGRTGMKVISVSPYGWSGPYQAWASDSLLLQAAAGISTLVGAANREPLMLPGFSVQYSAGCLAFIAGMAMTLSGDAEERHVLVTELESASTMHQFTYLAYTRLGWVRKRSQFMLPTATYMPCNDGEIVIAAVKPNHWLALAIVCERPDLLEREGYNTLLDRRLHAEALDEAIAPWFAGRSAETAFERLCSVGVPAAVIKSPSEAAYDPQFAHRKFRSGQGSANAGLPVPFLFNRLRPNRGDE